MYLVVGLGNPDRQYADTFHNVGFLVADRLARLLGASFDKGECRAICAHARLCGEKVIVAKPITYMNLSGESLKELVKKYKIEREKCVVVYDDADMPLGAIRLRKSGSGGSHNGMKNIIENPPECSLAISSKFSKLFNGLHLLIVLIYKALKRRGIF